MFFRIYPIIFSSIATNNVIKTWMKKANNFQIAKVQPQGVTSLLLNFFASFSQMLLVKELPIKKHVDNILLPRSNIKLVTSKNESDSSHITTPLLYKVHKNAFFLSFLNLFRIFTLLHPYFLFILT